MARGNIDSAQIKAADIAGNGTKFQMFGGGQVTTGHLAVYDANGNVVDGGPPGTGGGNGTVTSVGLAAPPEFTVTGSPVTTAGTLTIAKATQVANQVYAGPSSGVAALPTFRSLVANDIPNIAESQVTNLVSDLAAKAPLVAPSFTGPVTVSGSMQAGTIGGTTTTQNTNDTIKFADQAGQNFFIDRNYAGQTIYGFTTPKAAGGNQWVWYDNATDRVSLFAIVGKGTSTGADSVNISNAIPLNIGTAGTTQSAAIVIANASTATGSAKQTQIATGITTPTLSTIAGTLLAIADAGANWHVNIDTSGNLGVRAGLYATTLNVYPTASATGILVTGSTNPQIGLTDGTNPYHMGIAAGNGSYFTDSLTGDAILRFQTNLRIGRVGAASAMTVQSNIVEFTGAIAVTSTPTNVNAGTTGWKMLLYGGSYRIGVAGATLALMAGGPTGFVSIFGSSNPANTSTGSAPDANAAASIGANGVFYSGATAGVTGPTTYTVSSLTSFTVKGGLVTAAVGTSDERLKIIERPYKGGLDAILKLHPVYYRWNEVGAKYTGLPGDKTYLGFTAQDAQKAIAECIPGTEGDGYLSFDDRPIVAALVSALKELVARVETLEAKWAKKKSS